MGSLLSLVQYAYYSLKDLIKQYDFLYNRISLSPGIPQLNDSVPYWTIPLSSIARHGHDIPLPLDADIVIIGSGITGTSVAKALLEQDKGAVPLHIVMLDARDACSGATGRNGGHISPLLYNEYSDLKKAHGVSTAQEILRFRVAHISSLLAVAEEEDLLSASQARIVDDFDAFMHPETFGNAKTDLQTYLMEVSKDLREGFGVIDTPESIQKLDLAPSILGLIVKPGASVHAYRLVTGILSKLLCRFANFQLFTRTPCTQITVKEGTYVISTPKGDIRTQHVIHATNAWASHLLPGLRRKIIPLREHMSAQVPGKGLMSARNRAKADEAQQQRPWAGSRAFVFYPGKLEMGCDYLTQLLPNPSSTADLPTAGEFLFGRGAMSGPPLKHNIGLIDDGSCDVEACQTDDLDRYFASQEGAKPDSEAWGQGRVKAMWTGLLGVSADSNPWVGRVPSSVSAREEPVPLAFSPSRSARLPTELSEKTPSASLAAPGEWICAGYSGEGMVHAWLCGRALARMILGVQTKGATDLDLPKPFLITEKRVKKAKVENLLHRM